MADAKPRCRLYLQVPAPLTAKLEAQLNQALANSGAACVLLCDDGQPIDEAIADRIIDLVQGAGVACLIENNIALAESLGADGVHIPADAHLYKSARELLGESANIGVGCGFDRHEAMRLAEMGANYVAFGPDQPGDPDAFDQCAELMAWWSEILVVPCIAWNIDVPKQAGRLARAGADFVAPSRTVWPEDPAASIFTDIDNAMRRARTAA